MAYILKHFSNNILIIILSSILFMCAGYFIPNIYYQYLDNTQYYSVKSPIEVEQLPYEPCGAAKIYMVRNSQLDGQGKAIINLNLIKEDGSQGLERIEETTREISFSKGSGLIILSWDISCKAKPGKYFFEGTVAYDIRGFERCTPFTTVSFDVVASGSGELK